MAELSNDVIIAGVREVVESYQTLKAIGLKKQQPGFVINHLAKLFENETCAIGEDSQTIGYIRKVYKVYKSLRLWDEEGAPDILIGNLIEILEREISSNQNVLNETETVVNNNNVETERGGEGESQSHTDNVNLDNNQQVNLALDQVDEFNDNHINENDSENEGQVNPFASPSSQDSRATEQLDEQTGCFVGSGDDQNIMDLENSQSLEFQFQMEPNESCPTPLISPESDLIQSTSDSQFGSRGVKCPMCNVTVESDDQLPAHIRSHLFVVFCQFCKQSFRDSATYQNHIQEMHHSQIQSINDSKTMIGNSTTTFSPFIETTSPDFQVPGPSSSSGGSSSAISMEVGEPAEASSGVRKTKHQCHICKLYLSSVTSLTQHVLIHTDQKPFACSYCGRRFRQTGTLNRHISVHETSLTCRHPGCSFSFNSNEERVGHERVPHAILEPAPAQTVSSVAYILLD